MNPSIARLPIDSFEWTRWTRGTIWVRLGVQCRKQDIVNHKEVLRRYAVGYREGHSLACRSKPGEVAILFIIDDHFCWTHIREDEFREVFGD